MPLPTLAQDKIIALVFPIVAALVTLFRLAERTRRRRLWYDDAWAAAAMMFNNTQCVVNYLYLSDFAHYSKATNVALYYTIVQFFVATVWASRISILFTVMRLASPFGVLRKWLMLIFISFVMTWIILFAQSFWICESNPDWKSLPRPQCELGPPVAIARMITDIIGDALLIIIPCRIVYKVRLSRSQKIRVISIFSASAITTLICLVHAYYVFKGNKIEESVTAIIETSICLIVANLSVVVAFFFRIGTEEQSAFTQDELKSVVTFGAQPARPQADPLSTTAIGAESVTVADDVQKDVEKGSGDGESVTLAGDAQNDVENGPSDVEKVSEMSV